MLKQTIDIWYFSYMMIILQKQNYDSHTVDESNIVQDIS